ncbi:MAG: non-ribosomal peptide synthetase, partial [Candidatus Binatia bacterium]
SSLRFIRSSSAPLPPKVMADLEELFQVPVIEAYGMTEASHQIASNPLPPHERKAGSVGQATGSEVAIMDEGGNLLSSGEIGEVVIRGANVTHGYENDSEGNGSAFAHGWLRTGDQGYLDTDGYLFLTGRFKEIINRGGEKVSLREIDDVLTDHPAVAQAVSFAVPHPTLGEDVAAAVVLRGDAGITEKEVQAFAASRLADFKIPSRIWIVDEIPKGATGKVRRADLAGKFALQAKPEFVAPNSALEKIVASIYAAVLGVERVGAGDNFFALGGDSLRATQVISRLQAILPINLPIATVFNKATVADLAAEIAGAVQNMDPTVVAEVLPELTIPWRKHPRQPLAAKPQG